MSGWVLSQRRFVEVHRALAALGIPGLDTAPVQVVGSHRILADDDAYDLLERALAATGPAPLVEVILQSVADTRHNALALAMTASPTVAEALARACRYEAFWVTTSDLSLQVAPDRILLSVRSPLPPRPGRRVAHACMLAALVRHLHQSAEVDVAVIGVELTWSPGQDIPALTRCFGQAPTFGAATDAVHLRPSSLDTPMRLAHAPFAAFFDASVEALVTQVLGDADATWQERAAGQIVSHLAGGAPSLDALARALGVSGRTLQRHLAAEGTTHRQLLVDTRHRLALSALAHRSNSVAEVAFALGYEHPGSFIRAFRAWTGQTPGSWRRLRWSEEAGSGAPPGRP